MSSVILLTVIRIATSTVAPILTIIHGLTGMVSIHTGIVTMFTTTPVIRTRPIVMGGHIMKIGFIGGNQNRIVTVGRQAWFMVAIAIISEDIPVTMTIDQTI